MWFFDIGLGDLAVGFRRSWCGNVHVGLWSEIGCRWFWIGWFGDLRMGLSFVDWLM